MEHEIDLEDPDENCLPDCKLCKKLKELETLNTNNPHLLWKYADMEEQVAELKHRNLELAGIVEADDERLKTAAISVWGEYVWGCDTAEHMAELIIHLRNRVSQLEVENNRLSRKS